MVAPDSHRVSLVPWYLGTDYLCLSFRLQVFHFLWRTIPSSSATKDSIEYRLPCNPIRLGFASLRVNDPFNLILAIAMSEILRSKIESNGLGSSRFARRYLGDLYPPRLASKRGWMISFPGAT